MCSSDLGISRYIVADGTNWRLINRTGCPTAAVITNVGSGYTSAPTVTASAGGSLWKAIVGGAINTTVTVTTAGTYNYVPTIVFSAPPAGGINATGTVEPEEVVDVGAQVAGRIVEFGKDTQTGKTIDYKDRKSTRLNSSH